MTVAHKIIYTCFTMPRKPRIDLPGYVYHVITRGIEKRKIFIDSKDYQEFLRRFGLVLENDRGKCFAWSLMPNHIHLLLRSGHFGIAHMMRSLLTGYAVYFNLRHKRAGHLFQNRYKATLCNHDEYLHVLVRYIHLNPLNSGLVRDLEELKLFQWSGDSVLMDIRKYEWQDTESVLGLFGKTTDEGRKGYRRFIAEGLNSKESLEESGLVMGKKELDAFLKFKINKEKEESDNRILAGGDFVREIKKQVLDDQPVARTPKKKIEDIIRIITEMNSLNKNIFQKKTQNRNVVLTKSIIAYYAHHICGYSLTEICKELNTGLSGICRLLARNNKKIEKFPFAEIEKRLS
ncbi:MAG: transposase [bacterium]